MASRRRPQAPAEAFEPIRLTVLAEPAPAAPRLSAPRRAKTTLHTFLRPVPAISAGYRPVVGFRHSLR